VAERFKSKLPHLEKHLGFAIAYQWGEKLLEASPGIAGVVGVGTFRPLDITMPLRHLIALTTARLA
jgi:hypothetical protein